MKPTIIAQSIWQAYGRAHHHIHFATAMYAHRIDTTKGPRIVWRWK